MSHLVLIGLMGAGKSTVGRRCATRLGRPFVDTDDVVVTMAGMPIDELFDRYGEPHMREIERAAVVEVCASPEPLVIACGGGTVLDPENRRVLRASGVVVWLRASPDVLARRVGTGTSRPLLRDDPLGALRRLERLREPAYEAAAQCVLDTDELSPDEVATQVLAQFESVSA